MSNQPNSLYQNSKVNLGSLFKQTGQVGLGFLVMLLLIGGKPSGLIVGLSVCLGIGFVASSEVKRLALSDNQLSRDCLTNSQGDYEIYLANNNIKFSEHFLFRKDKINSIFFYTKILNNVHNGVNKNVQEKPAIFWLNNDQSIIDYYDIRKILNNKNIHYNSLIQKLNQKTEKYTLERNLF